MGRISSEEIRQLRGQLDLNQAQFAALLGFGVATLNRYENGVDPTAAHAELIFSLRDPIALARLLKDKEEVLGDEIHKRLLQHAAVRAAGTGLARIEELLSQEKDSTLNGGRTFSPDRFKQLVLLFTQSGEWKTKLNKLLFYADFLSFKQLKKSLTGTKYVVGYYGPIPNNHEFLYASLLESGALRAQEEFRDNSDQPVEKLFASEGIKLDAFTPREQEIIRFTIDYFKSMSAKRIADYSHDEEAYRAHSLGQAISYAYAKHLRLQLDASTLTTGGQSSLWAAIQSAMQHVHPDDFKKLPKDGAANIDHYLYGAPKRKT